MFNRKYIFKRSMFHCYVSLPEGRFFGICESNMYETFTPDSLKNAVFFFMSPFKSKFGGFEFFWAKDHHDGW